MKGLLIKDFYNLFGHSKTLLIMGVFFTVSGIAQKNMLFLTGMISVLSTMMVLTSFSYDEAAKWDRYALSMPISRSEIVLSKYLLTGIMLMLGLILSAFFSFIAYFFTSAVKVIDVLSSIGGSVVAVVVLMSILIPAMYKYGVEKSRMILMGIAVVPTIIILALSKIGVQAPSEGTIKAILYLSPVVAIVGIIASYFTSCKIYAKKEV